METRPDGPRRSMPASAAEGRTHEPRNRTKLYCVPQGTVLGDPDDEQGHSGLKKSLAIRIDAELLAATRDCARRDNRSLSNFIETALRRRIEEMTEAGPAPDAVTREGNEA